MTAPSARPPKPSPTVTFLFSDVEGSTALLRRLKDGYAEVLAKHEQLLCEAANCGLEPDERPRGEERNENSQSGFALPGGPRSK